MARNVLKQKVTWNTTGAVAANFDSDKAKKDYANQGIDPNAKTMDAFKRGDSISAMINAKQTIEATYWTEHCYHAQLEPMNCIARIQSRRSVG